MGFGHKGSNLFLLLYVKPQTTPHFRLILMDWDYEASFAQSFVHVATAKVTFQNEK